VGEEPAICEEGMMLTMRAKKGVGDTIRWRGSWWAAVPLENLGDRKKGKRGGKNPQYSKKTFRGKMINSECAKKKEKRKKKTKKKNKNKEEKKKKRKKIVALNRRGAQFFSWDSFKLRQTREEAS